MADLHIPPAIVETAQAAGSALGPAAIGAAVSQAYKRGLSYGQRLIQMTVGILVSYFVGGALVAVLSPSPSVADAISFVLAMIAYEATPGFIREAADVVASIPGGLRDRFLTDSCCQHDAAPPEWRAPARTHDNDNDPETRAEEA